MVDIATVNVTLNAPAQSTTVYVPGIQGTPGVIQEVLGTTNEITSTLSGAGNSIATLSIPSAFIAPGTIQDTTGFYTSTSASVSAAGTTQGTATALTKSYNVITTVASGAGVILPTPSVGGLLVTLVNKGANALTVYPASGGQIGSAGTNAGVTLAVNGTTIYQSASTSQWYTPAPNVIAGSGMSVTYGSDQTTITNTGATSIVAGTDISVSGATGAVTVNDTSTLATVTGRGATTSTALSITNSTNATSTSTGCLVLSGGLGVNNNIYLGGNLHGASLYYTGVIVEGYTGSISAAGTNQGTATALSSTTINSLTTVASGTGVILPTPSQGQKIIVKNGGANPVLLYPASGASIDGGTTNAAITIPTGALWTGVATSSTAWWSAVPTIAAGTNISATYASGQVTLAVTGTVTSITGTANEITASASTGAVTLSLPQNVIIPTPVSGIALAVSSVSGSPSATFTGPGTVPLTIQELTAPPNNVLNAYVGIATAAFTGGSGINGDLVLCPRTSNDNSLLLVTGNAGAAAVRMSIGGSGNVTINAPASGIPLAASGSIRAGVSATAGNNLYLGTYSSGDIFVAGSLESSGATFLGYGVGVDTGTSNGFLSTTAINVVRSAIALGQSTSNAFSIYTGAAQTTAIGSTPTLSQRVLVAPAGNVTLNTPDSGTTLTVGGVNGAVAAVIQNSSGADGRSVLRFTNPANTQTYDIGVDTSGGSTLAWSVRNITGSTTPLTVASSGVVTVSASTASSSTSTGALVVTGGLGVGGVASLNSAQLFGGLEFYSTSGISAAGTTLGTATALTADTNIITTCASGAGVALPSTAGIGREITVINRGVNALLVYPFNSSGQIDGATAGAAVSVPVNGWITVDITATNQYFTIDPVLVAGTGITITQSNNGTVTIASTSSGGTVSSVNLTAGTGISVSGGPITTSGSITVNNTGVTSITGTANQITASASTGAVTLSLPTLVSSQTFYSSTTGASGFTMDAAGADYGYMANTTTGTWALGYGTSQTTLGTSALTWNTSGNIVLPTGSLTMGGTAGSTSEIVWTNGTAAAITANPTTYGSVTVSGEVGGYAGIQFTSAYGTNGRTFMLATASAVTGVYDTHASAWDWYFSGGELYDVTSCNGAWTVNGACTATSFNVSSDRAKKKNIKPITNALEVVTNLNGVSFDWREDDKPSLGLIAQDVEQVLPMLVGEDKKGFKTVNYDGVIGALVEAIKELTARVKELEAR